MKQTFLHQIEMEIALCIDSWNILFPNDTSSKLWEFICDEFKIDYDDTTIYEIYTKLRNPQ